MSKYDVNVTLYFVGPFAKQASRYDYDQDDYEPDYTDWEKEDYEDDYDEEYDYDPYEDDYDPYAYDYEPAFASSGHDDEAA